MARLSFEDVYLNCAFVADQALKVAIEGLPAAEHIFIEAIDVIFVPRVILRQLALTIMVQTGTVTVASLFKSARYILSSFSRRTRSIRSLRQRVKDAASQTEWQQLAEEIDRLEGNDQWRLEPQCALYESERLIARIEEFKHLIRRHDIFDLMFTLRGGISRSKYGLLHEGLFSKAMAGTKLLVEEYNAMICAGLDFVCDGSVLEGDEPIPNDARLAFFNETRHGYGRTAMLLSGGAALGFYHAGVVKALVENKLMPRVIGGASAGSILCAMIGTRTDDELTNDLFYVRGTDSPGHSGILALDFFRPQGYSITHDYSKDNPGCAIDGGVTSNTTNMMWDLKRALHFLTPRGLQAMGNVFLDVLLGRVKMKHALMNDTNHFRRCCRMNIGNFTFQEAFDRTGRILNITVSPQNRSDPPRLLNYLTAPHVLIWSAAVASSAVPGLFEASKLLVKDSDGTERFESTSGARFQDGSMENDLPMQQLSEMFNINHFIISQVNPHAYLLASFSGKGRGVWSNPILGLANGLLQFLKESIKAWIRNTVEFAGGRRLAPTWELRRGFFTQLLTQEYEGREGCDVTINPWGNHRSIFSAFLHCVYNPSNADYAAWQLASEKETWKHLPEIRSHGQVEQKLDQCVQKLRRKILKDGQVRRSGGGSETSGGMGNRVPSFYTSPSLVNLSGLAVGDKPLLTGNNSMKKSKSKGSDGSFGEGAPTMDSGSEDGRSQGGDVAPGSPMSSSSAPTGGGDGDGYVKSTSMAAFYYRRNKSNDSLKI
ncbi:hypothetical protein TrVE_jg11607 [Triparma verrucosa]|uniref:PNPLA domain-containing protein n=1 Tax=Triparma verrucosa TaxID=1606542 RepID=A0A9W7EMN3_9STRA|nr:hypothetical protein TrVE_jg11607 [Triparma verrucosa]